MAEQFNRISEAADDTFFRGDDLNAIPLGQLLLILRRNHPGALSAYIVGLIAWRSHGHYGTLHRRLLHRAEVGSIGKLDLPDHEGQQNKQVQVFNFVVHFVFNISSNVLNKKCNQ